MPEVHRLGDANDDGGDIADTVQNTVFANNLPIAVNGSSVNGHGLDFPTVTANGSATVFINGIPVNRSGDEDECGHVRDQGSPDVFVE
jgi:uncharacterized Zn-binding protein involved in type VI secretion